jgi:hypothetical protein
LFLWQNSAIERSPSELICFAISRIFFFRETSTFWILVPTIKETFLLSFSNQAIFTSESMQAIHSFDFIFAFDLLWALAKVGLHG